MKFAHGLIALLFVLFAYWQLNDPDWPLWLGMYGSVAVVAGSAAAASPRKWFVYLALAVSTIWMLTMLPDLISWIGQGSPTIAGRMEAESPHIELTREFFGLLICSLTLGWYAYRFR